jgi:hypothetical protein
MKLPVHVLLATVLLAGPVAAQSTPDAGRPVAPDKPALLAPDKQAKIRDQAARSKLQAAELPRPAEIGMTVPSSVALHALPEDSVTELPTVTAYHYFVAGERIAIVDPVSRRIVQLIDR